MSRAARVDGFTGAFGASVVDEGSEGVALAFGGNVNRGLHTGVQAAFGFNTAQRIEGIQTAMFDWARSVRGAQFGMLNVAKNVRGVQVGRESKRHHFEQNFEQTTRRAAELRRSPTQLGHVGRFPA